MLPILYIASTFGLLILGAILYARYLTI